MSLNGMMRTGVSGMAGQASRLATVADNIANANTTGYKRVGNAFFSQVVDSDTGVYVPGSLGNHVYNEISRQGPIRGTTSPTDLAISGSGFFVIQSEGGDTYLTRAGSYNIDSEGYLTDSSDRYLMGYDLTNGTTGSVANGFGGLSQINVGSQKLEAIPTTSGSLVPNLDSRSSIVAAANLPTANAATAEFSGKSSLVVYDSLGGEQLVDVYFAKTSTTDWEVSVYNAADAASGGGFPYSSAALTSQTLAFDLTTGEIVGGGAPSLSFTVPNGVAMTVDMEGISQLASTYSVNAETNGSAPSSVERVEIDDDGIVYGVFANGYSQPLFQVALATVPSPDNLRKVAGTAFSVSLDSGDVQVGRANIAGLGGIQSGALEESNVDMATELTIMIESQRSYTANSKVFQTGAQLMEVLVNLSR
ncbi:MAG: flagellar hook protein FlgE [Rhizobiaceae bacterium]|nr:flagellar hook protein FlgE [Rhizobiaceae bacterium]